MVGAGKGADGSCRGAAPEAVDRPVVPALAVQSDLKRGHRWIASCAGLRRCHRSNDRGQQNQRNQRAARRRRMCGVCAYHRPARVQGLPPTSSTTGSVSADVLLRGLMTYEDAMSRLIELAKENGGTLTAAQVESDPVLAGDESTVSAAARALGGSTNVFSSDEPDGRTWFPFRHCCSARSKPPLAGSGRALDRHLERLHLTVLPARPGDGRAGCGASSTPRSRGSPSTCTPSTRRRGSRSSSCTAATASASASTTRCATRFAAAGLDYNRGEIVPNTKLPLRLTELARERELHEPFHDRLMDAYWRRRRTSATPSSCGGSRRGRPRRARRRTA